ncbi:hypothetical protein PsorP6_015833 [Peronosclerospora sorghi]|uniref:Uncharacterized protein n=1 Tax=Peronosclerospora sorghi TaxID=230839 RepID=A0ACC0WMV9_9STRA|nr:hypothetical protein PsorP6_015833 [Peronosclerospora sorghi]
MTASIYGGRYMIFMIGAFAIYAGVIYNDFFSLPLNLFGSKFAYPDDCLDSHHRDVKCVAEYKIHGHMTYVNATDVSNGDNYATFFFEFVPQIVFAVSRFFYMVVLIVLKWIINWTERMKHKVCPYNFAGITRGLSTFASEYGH